MANYQSSISEKEEKAALIRVICLKVVLKRELIKNSKGEHEVQDENKVYRFNAESSIKHAFDMVNRTHPDALFVEVYEPRSCALTSDRI